MNTGFCRRPAAVIALALLLGPGVASAGEAAATRPAGAICSDPIADVHAQVATIRALSAELTAATDRLEDLLAQEPALPQAGSADAEAMDGYRRDLQTWQAQVEGQQQRIRLSRDQLGQGQQAIEAAQTRMNACIARETRSRLGSARTPLPASPPAGGGA